MAKRDPVQVRAAGGVVWRRAGHGLETALIHRPRYDDWSLPKGKLDDGETELAAAVREIEEEMGAHVCVSGFVDRVAYDVAAGRKTSAFWSMRYTGGDFVPNDEVDELRWLPLDTARALLSYSTDRRVLDGFAAVPPAESVIVLVRHAKAGKRSQWKGADDLRPLEPAGLEQADRLVPFLSRFGAEQVVSAEPLRCIQTVTPFASAANLRVDVDVALGDRAWEVDPVGSITALFTHAARAPVTVVSSQGGAIPGLIDHVVPGRRSTTTRKASAWVLTIVDGAVATADHYDDAAR